MRPLDTTPEAARVQFRVLRRMGERGRVEAMFSLCESMRGMLETGVRHRHPDYDDERVRLAVIRIMLGEDLFRRAYPGVDIKP